MENQTIVNLDDVSSAGAPFLKTGEYSIRCIGAVKKNSKAGNPMVEFDWEIVAPETVATPDGKQAKITGLQCRNWIVLNAMGFPRLKALHKTAKLPMTIDLNNLGTQARSLYVGKAVKATLKTTIKAAIDENTSTPMLDDNGQPIITNQYDVVRFNASDDAHTVPADSVPF